uniref:Uncharacterized protein n=1 Tax=Siphoviridae sp. ctHip2 TaxID=2827830 RepID=A0A8S5RVV7_9CAUD|nr:MAG TPA: hypothetical protein [Siphoviridae sp. ctHip2]
MYKSCFLLLSERFTAFKQNEKGIDKLCLLLDSNSF